ncbi:NAD(P) transhydrogenase subunit beta [Sinobacterium caligoides]|uniref:NAD(P) transhydrogenase subunit beta n=1 Tax=Sinobacterium caligoides TaxID=933926 RepID=A0A3N2DZP5_9GAMM|nr:NAD(P)(+) transhydrogenase (Re/Si-specific) subunit beta [Sinobacterium caligoides]ROS04909.1 NAD(P) transhydrogenase subunit beta [Sinobacterium caligoides]
MNLPLLINLAYVASAILFILGLKKLSSPATARNGNLLSALGMLIAIIATLASELKLPWGNIVGALILGSLVGAVAAKRVQMTGMPELVALFNGLGGAASLLVGWSALYPAVGVDGLALAQGISTFTSITIVLSILIGGITLTGSMVAYGKLSEKLSSGAIQFPRQQIVNAAIVVAILFSAFMLCLTPSHDSFWLCAILILSLVFGVMIVIPIGGADMPVVIALLNSYSGLAACAAGFVLNNNLLIVAGSLVGTSGIILTNIMCKAMNRSLSNVLFSGFAAAKESTMVIEGEVKPIVAEDAYLILEAAQRVVIVPGYGMAVAQAQHVVKELMTHLESNGCDVQFAIHPVAGRMPGHMNVLLAEANVPYEQLVEMDDINPQMSNMDVAIVIGANDVVNPAANEDEGSPLYGMPVINVTEARTVFVLKRSMGAGFSGVENPLFFAENTRMLFGDAKESLGTVVSEFSE